MLRSILRNTDQSLADQALINALPALVNLTSGIAKTGYNLASKFTTGVVGGMMGGGSKIAESIYNKSSIGKGKKSKNPHYSNVSPGRVIPVRKGDGEADIIAKLYNFMLKNYEQQKKNDELRRNFELEQREEDERRHKKLIDAITKGTTGDGTDGTKDGFFTRLVKGLLSKLQSGFKFLVGILKVLGKVMKNVMELPFKLFKFMRKFKFGGISGTGRSAGVGAILRGVARATGIAGLTLEGFRALSDERQQRLKEDRDYNKPLLQSRSPDGNYELKSPSSHENISIPLSEDERLQLLQTYDALDNADLTPSQRTELNNKVFDIFSNALKRKRESGQQLSQLERDEETNINVAERLIESADSELRELGDDMDEMFSGVDDEFKRWFFRNMSEEQERDFRKFFFDEEAPTTPPPPAEPVMSPEGAATNVEGEQTLPAMTITDEPEIIERAIRRAWVERDIMSGIETPIEEKNKIINRLIQSPTLQDAVNFKNILINDVERLKNSGSDSITTINNVNRTGRPKSIDTSSTKVRDPRPSMRECNRNNVVPC